MKRETKIFGTLISIRFAKRNFIPKFFLASFELLKALLSSFQSVCKPEKVKLFLGFRL